MWVIAEQENGQLMNVTFELLGAAKELCAKLEEKCCAVLVTAVAGELPQQLIAAGADVVYVIEDAKYADYDTELYTDAICQLSKKYDPASIMFGATDDGRDLAPRVAARLHTGLCADCTALDVTDDKLVAWTRPALGGNICATIICDVNRPQMGTVRPKVFKPAELDNTRTGEVIAFVPEAGAVSRVELVKKEALSSENAVKIDEADMIAAGGRGFGSKEKFDVLEQLAALFENSAVAGTRAAIDEGWLTHSQQVGQSGKSVTPHIYFACGISGAIQHLSGMKDSDIIIAINKDAEAPIFTVAHYGIVGDVNVILPKLIEKIKAYKA
ncbi:MAG: electron transfer flavoprotein subunit alpha/FixB family protein [Phascolarctobacterium succinatutens]|uniref:electron transfer flavoprotein subunit alpha/FixB family protein n=1 Tax=Phascolarctobacterium succinatutens TaxID=626940 RepID=UPI0026F202AF|nr:electron transfer flavoprotein subunit alpha/FixB family protein [Phascolarctobacterium succinatutens]